VSAAGIILMSFGPLCINEHFQRVIFRSLSAHRASRSFSFFFTFYNVFYFTVKKKKKKKKFTFNC